MLDSETKRRINTARDILVGKVPDPKSQVEQITIALIYKFMDDIDAESEELGGGRAFFADDFSRYGWAKLMRSGLGGHETLHLYAEAITRMPENPGIPSLFRDIFKNAYLPYRDPETLKLFLKVIDEFTYDHSERLGDAFEYLLSILGSQGDAGQFRTPRHIIDFMVSIIDPKKTETILDPACGTAGFLIASYRHIRRANRDDDGRVTLTPDEKRRLAANLKGYDISPDMVRLSLVNLYLHGFVEPHIYEYDTLTSEERWSENADVILANPPFMSPKGGIKPHQRFSVTSKRSEVLFVDYMAEHLTTTGRAGIIVPEGIIFQSQNAYRQLRTMLVETALVAVVSLPAGIFNPYSGVKTSILILDRALAKKTDRIAFFRVENDGFDLGAQRRQIEQNDLPRVATEIAEYLRRLRGGVSVDDFQPALGLVVKKERIAADGEWNLSGARYRERKVRGTVRYDWVELSEVILGRPQYGSGARKVPYDGKVRYVRISDITENGDLKSENIISPSMIEPDLFLMSGDLLIARSGSVGRTYIHKDIPNTCQYAGYLIRFRINPAKAIPEYVYHVTKSDSWRKWIRSNSKTGTLTNINAKQYSSFRFPLPPLEAQQAIVAEIEGYQQVIDGARAVVDNYRPHIWVDPEWPLVALGEVCELVRGVTYSKDDEAIESGHQVLRANNIAQDMSMLNLSEIKRVSDSIEFPDKKKFHKDDIFICLASGSKNHIGKVALIKANTEFYFGGFMGAIRVKQGCLHPAFLFQQLRDRRFNDFLREQIAGANINNLGAKLLYRYKIPLPPLAVQQAIVAEIEAEQSLVNANRELIERFQRKIDVAIARVWGEDTATEV